MESAWGVEHGSPITKSLVGQNKFVPATKLGAKGLKAARKKMLTNGSHARNPMMGEFDLLMRQQKVTRSSKKRDLSYPLEAPGKAGVYGRRGDARTDLVTDFRNEGGKLLAQIKEGASGTKTFKSKSGKKYKVHVIPGYDNAHPLRTGSKKRGTTEIIAGENFLQGKDAAKVMRHEVLHGDNKSSWRTAQINSSPRSRLREEARADTLSGTYKINPLGEQNKTGVLSHTAANRSTPGRGQREFRRTQDSIFQGRGQSPKVEAKQAGAGYSRTFGKPNSSGPERAKRYAMAGAAAGGVGGGAAYGNHKLKGRQRRAKDGKFA